MNANVDGIREYLGALVRIGRGLPEGMTSPHQFMLDHGRAFEVTPESFAGPRAEAKQCFMNAGRLALEDDSLIYVEGYTTCLGLPIHHAWLSNAAGEVIEPTLRDNDERAFFGLAFRTSYLRKTILKKGTWGLLDDMSPTLQAIVKGHTDGMLEVLEIASA